MLDAQVDKWQQELQEIEDEWQAKFNDYDKRKLILTDQGRAKAEKELQWSGGVSLRVKFSAWTLLIILILVAGLVYAWRKGVFEWHAKQ